MASDPLVASKTTWAGVNISMTNGFRFGPVILSAAQVSDWQSFYDGRAAGDITLRDLYALFPVSVALTVAEFSGLSIEQDLESVLSAVFNRNPFLQRGGWYMGLSNMTQKIDLNNRPFSSSGGRIVETMIGGVPLDPSERYVFASCYPHGDPIDRVCRTSGGNGHLFFQLADADDFASGISLTDPVTKTGVITDANVIHQVAPDKYLHPVHVLRRYLTSRYLTNHVVTEAQFGTGRIQTVNSTILGNPVVDPPVSTIDKNFIQPPEGAGPKFFSGIVGGL